MHGPQDTRLDEIPEPQVVRPDQVKVRVSASGICGTDLWLHRAAPIPRDYRHPAFGEPGPHVLGHEMAGEVVEIGKNVSRVASGDLVAVRPLVADGSCDHCVRGESNLCRTRGFLGIHGGGGGFSQYVVVPDELLHRLPAPFDASTGALVETLATSWRGVKRVAPEPGEPALVVGAGPIGLATVMCLRAWGVGPVLVVGRGAVRLDAAAAMGAVVCASDREDLAGFVDDATHGRGTRAAFDCTGSDPAMVGALLEVVQPGGTVMVLAEYHEPAVVDMTDLLRRGKRLTGSTAYTAEDFDEVIDAVVDGRLDPAPLVTSTVPLERALEDGIGLLERGGRRSEIKVVVTP